MTSYKTYETMVEEYKQLYPEIFTGKYVFGTSFNMIQVMSKLPETETDENISCNPFYTTHYDLPFYCANVLKFEFRFNRFNPEQKEYDFDWKHKNICYMPNGDIHLIRDYATYFNDLEQTFYFDIVHSNPKYTGIVKMWDRTKTKLVMNMYLNDGIQCHNQQKSMNVQ